MAQRQQESRVRVPLSWAALNETPVSETGLLEMVRQLPVESLLPALVSLLQYGDASEPPAYEVLDRRVRDLFPTETARRITVALERESHWMFFSKWQLLLAIKLICVFGYRGKARDNVDYSQFLKLLLMVNGFYPGGEEVPNTPEGAMEAVQETALQGYSLIQYEHPRSLIGRYAELFGRLTSTSNQAEFDNWVDIRNVLATELGIQLDDVNAVLFALYARSSIGASWPGDGTPGPRLGTLDPEIYFADTQLSKEELAGVLHLVRTSPEQIRDQHLAAYGETLGNPVDFGLLLRNPVIELPDGSLADISGQLLVQRYTCGLYWDIHDALPDDKTIAPNRGLFQTFFGELHEQYGRDVLRRILASQMGKHRKSHLKLERDYAVNTGSNPDGLLVETIGRRNTRCTLFEFKVGRPRYIASIVEGDVQAFHNDMRTKIEAGVDQEINFCQQLSSGLRVIPDLPVQDITKWFFVIVVTDPFPSWEILLKPLRQRLGTVDLGKVRLCGPFILSLSELEELGTLPEKRVSDLLIEWANGPDSGWPFHSFYAHRTSGQPIRNEPVARLADQEMDHATVTLFGKSVGSPQA